MAVAKCEPPIPLPSTVVIESKGSDDNRIATAGAEGKSQSRTSPSWAMLTQGVVEVDPLSWPECGSQMALMVLIELPQCKVIENILRHYTPVVIVGSQGAAGQYGRAV